MSNEIRTGTSINSIYKFSLYSNLLSAKKPEKSLNVNQLINIIKLGHNKGVIKRLRSAKSKEEYQQIKRSEIPCVTLSGIFGGRNAAGLLSHSGLIQIDIDHDKHLKDSLDILRKDEYTYLCFLSPGGKGIKVVVKINPSKDTHRSQFLALEKYYLDEFGIVIDASCKDISRAMLLSYDPYIYCNSFSEVFEECYVQEPAVNVLEEHRVVYSKKVSYSADEGRLVENITSALEKASIDITADYSDWVRLGYALDSGLGERGRSYFHRISTLYPGYDSKETDVKYDQLSANNNGSATLATLYYMAKQAGVEVDQGHNKRAAVGKKVKVSVNTSIKTQEERDFELSDNLKKLRLFLAKSNDVKAFQVFYNRTLAEIVREKPTSFEQLLKIEGIGKKKVDWFGKEMLEVVEKYL